MARAELSLDGIRSIVQDSLGKHLYENAIFFADKLVTLSNNEPDDVYRLVQVFVYTKQFRRALNLLQSTKLGRTDARFRYITAKCLAECQEWEECLDTLGDDTPSDEVALLPPPAHPKIATQPSLPASCTHPSPRPTALPRCRAASQSLPSGSVGMARQQR